MPDDGANTVDVLFFGATADITGARKVSLELPPDSRSRNAFEKVVEKYPKLSSYRLFFSLNQEHASGEELVRDGDELAIFTAVSGG